MPSHTPRRRLAALTALALAVLIHRITKRAQNTGPQSEGADACENPYQPIAGTSLTPQQKLPRESGADQCNTERGDANDTPANRSVAKSTSTIAWLTGGLVLVGVLGFGASMLQWSEIHSGSSDTHALAQAAVDQARAAKEAVATAHNNMVSSQRAWVGAIDASITSLESNKPFDIKVMYSNSGHEPAIHLQIFLTPVTIDRPSFYPENFGKDIGISKDKCFAKLNPVGGVALPGGGYTITAIGKNFMPPLLSTAVVSGQQVAAIVGCFVYYSQEKIRHSAFCFLYDGLDQSDINHLQFCPWGNDVD